MQNKLKFILPFVQVIKSLSIKSFKWWQIKIKAHNFECPEEHILFSFVIALTSTPHEIAINNKGGQNLSVKTPSRIFRTIKNVCVSVYVHALPIKCHENHIVRNFLCAKKTLFLISRPFPPFSHRPLMRHT
jgi:hypothetical protein